MGTSESKSDLDLDVVPTNGTGLRIDGEQQARYVAVFWEVPRQASACPLGKTLRFVWTPVDEPVNHKYGSQTGDGT
jgi:hypothetical protein